MEDAVSFSPEDILEHTTPVNDEGDATYHISTMVIEHKVAKETSIIIKTIKT